MANILNTSIGRKIAMALSGFFLIVFLLQHFTINFTSIINKDIFNSFSHFMGSNFLVQFILQPVLIFGVLFHFLMGFVLDIKNRNARHKKYISYKSGATTTWVSRNMILTGIVILSFLGLHFYDFWFPEINYKYIASLPPNPDRYYYELIHKFENPTRVIIYCLSFIFLSLHLLHGFQSAFQSIGFNNKYLSGIKIIGKLFAVFIPLGFIFIAVFHYLKNINII